MLDPEFRKVVNLKCRRQDQSLITNIKAFYFWMLIFLGYEKLALEKDVEIEH